MKRNPTIVFALAALACFAAPLRAQDGNPSPDAPAAPPPPQPAIFELSQVEIMPEMVNRSEVVELITRNYPREMRRRHERGTVTLRMVVRPDGTVDSASVAPQVATDTAFVAGAVEVARAMRFRPAQLDGHPVAVWVTLPVQFWMEPRTPPPAWTPGSRPR